MKECVRFI